MVWLLAPGEFIELLSALDPIFKIVVANESVVAVMVRSHVRYTRRVSSLFPSVVRTRDSLTVRRRGVPAPRHTPVAGMLMCSVHHSTRCLVNEDRAGLDVASCLTQDTLLEMYFTVFSPPTVGKSCLSVSIAVPDNKSWFSGLIWPFQAF